MSKDNATCMRWCPSIKFDNRNNLQLMVVWMLGSMGQLTPAYAATLGKFARFPVPSAYTLASIKTSFSTWKKVELKTMIFHKC